MDLKSSCKAPWPHSLQNFSRALSPKALGSETIRSNYFIINHATVPCCHHHNTKGEDVMIREDCVSDTSPGDEDTIRSVREIPKRI